MSVEFAILFPFAGLITGALILGAVALMVHYKYPRQSNALARRQSTSIWVEVEPQQDVAVGEDLNKRRPREFIQIRRVNS